MVMLSWHDTRLSHRTVRRVNEHRQILFLQPEDRPKMLCNQTAAEALYNALFVTPGRPYLALELSQRLFPDLQLAEKTAQCDSQHLSILVDHSIPPSRWIGPSGSRASIWADPPSALECAGVCLSW